MIHSVNKCNCCGKNLSGSKVVDYEKRQVFDIPHIEMLITEHRGEIKNCTHCHNINRAAFPVDINQPVQYGSNVQQLPVYFTQYQLLPYGRTSKIFKDLFGHALSKSFLVYNNHRFAVKLQPFIEDLKGSLLMQPVLHADETGFYFEGQRNWLHTCAQTNILFMPHTLNAALK